MSRIYTHIYTHTLSCKSDTWYDSIKSVVWKIVYHCHGHPKHKRVAAAVWRGFGKNMKSVLPTISMGLWMGTGGEEEEGVIGETGEKEWVAAGYITGSLYLQFSCLRIWKENAWLCVSKWQGEIAALFGVSSISSRWLTPFEERIHSFSNWKCSQDVYNFMDGRTPISQNLNGKTM